VHPNHWGCGIGSALMEKLMDAARSLGYHAVIARIAGESEASIRLHRKFGFEVVGVLKEVGWKFGRWHDLWIMEALL